jgi:hypothetical protein
MKRNFIFTGILTISLCLPASATIINIPDDYPTIQQGIDASSDGDTVLVQPETYVENINFNGHNIVLGSLFLTTGDTTYISETIIDGDSSGSVVTFESGEDSTTIISGFTLQNGFAYNGAGIFCNHSSPIIADNFIVLNFADSVEWSGQGGGIYCNNSNSIIRQNFITNNTAIVSGGIFCRDSDISIVDNYIANNMSFSFAGGIVSYSSNISATGNIISRNWGDIGGIYCSNSHLILTANTIEYNEVWGPWSLAGGVACSFSEMTIRDNEFTWNDSYGLACNSSDASVSQNFFFANTSGGIMCLEQSNIAVTNNIFTSNVGYFGCGIYCIESSPLIIGNTFLENRGAGVIPSAGGGIYCSTASPLIYRNYFLGNSVDYGGAIYCGEESRPSIRNNIFYENAADSAGGVIFCESADSVDFVNNSTVNNYSPSGIVASCNWSSHLNIVNSIVKEDSLSDQVPLFDLNSSSSVFVTYSDIQGGWEGEGNIDLDPLFRDPENGDFHLMSTACGDPYDSPCIDAGHPDSLDGYLSCLWGLGTIRSDIGAYGGGDSTQVGIDDQEPEAPIRFALAQNYPNPFNATTTLRYNLVQADYVTLTIYNIIGQRIAIPFEGFQQPGEHAIIWDALNQPSGVYFARLEMQEQSKSIKMVLLK